MVSILATFLVKSGHRDRLKLVWIGVGAAVAPDGPGARDRLPCGGAAGVPGGLP
ncbi:hypothetical protein [Kribbella catacumbae]|uniref:hypothetical protein n=1 Tax=Kribbella catacumbae TaxID=460086 RepID=UPI00192A7760